MKILSPIAMLILLGLVGSPMAVGQGISMFGLSNFPPDVPDARIFDGEGTPLGPDYSMELWGGVSSDLLVPAYGFVAGGRVITPFLGGGYFFSARSAVVPADSNGGYSWLQVRAWDSRLGATYGDVVALGLGGYGESKVFYADGADPTRILPEFPAPLTGLESFNLLPEVPEPSTWTLLALGAIAMCWGARRRPRVGQAARRRKQRSVGGIWK